ncbi:replication initiation and membrane attachment family protein [Lederbergia lenta]|uniref:replication initiation and membrane attachment family protein n=1 Tax=Lederbergia lenta TaxID=1467 RepID=UPI0020421ACD|nr:replication initiation and membrane attachment family protein [Lederbergia lenta]MCM3111142.1 replication initiation and membrane attachment family protein [Lederbergia lenta]
MKQHWNEVQPVDSFSVTMNGILHQYDHKVITFLYQPLIGPVCISFYSTLWHKVEENRLWSEEWSHYHLMNLLGLNLQEIYHARLKLEGIGLLKTHIKNEANTRSFVYELQAPLSAEQFFTDGMLNIYLYQKLGQSHFLKLKKSFMDKQVDTEAYQEITRSFQDVFTSLGTGSLQNMDGHEASDPQQGQGFFSREEAGPIHIDGKEFDFDLLLAGLTDMMVPRKFFTATVKDAIAKLSFIYGINAIEMQNIVLGSVTSDHNIDIEELRKAARDWYQLENDDTLPQLVDRHQPLHQRESISPGNTPESKLIYYLETVSPRQLLIDLSDGATPAKSDLHAVEDTMFKQKLTVGVTNVLIHYVMLKTDMKLSKNYLEKIASHWARKKIATVQSAMELAKSEHRQYQEWAAGNTGTNQRKSKVIRREKLPDWFTSEEQTKQPAKKENTKEFKERKRRLDAIQKKYLKNGGDKGGAN